MSRAELSQVIAFKEAQKLPCLQAVLKESMRMHPAVGLPLGRVVPEAGAVIAGQYFPAGVCFCLPALLHLENTGLQE